SYANMNAVAERIAGRVDYPLLIQGEAPKAALLETFRTTPGAVLLATASFWQGVDVVGEQLSCVIIDKLPFASPADPVVAARIERLRNRGGNPFGEYQVPAPGRGARADAGLGRAPPLRDRPGHPGRAGQPDRAEGLGPALPREPAPGPPRPRPGRGAELRGLTSLSPARRPRARGRGAG